jgi:hypothetical protein
MTAPTDKARVRSAKNLGRVPAGGTSAAFKFPKDRRIRWQLCAHISLHHLVTASFLSESNEHLPEWPLLADFVAKVIDGFRSK